MANTTISQGTLKMGASNALGYGTNAVASPSSSQLIFSATDSKATLDLYGFNETGGLLAGGGVGGIGTVTDNLASSTGSLTIGSGVTASTMFAGKIMDGAGAGLVALTKIGNGMQTLNGSVSHTFSGGINLNGGILLLDNLNMATPTDFVGSTNTLGLGGGTLSIKGKTGAFTTNQTIGNVTVNAGGGQILGDKNSGTALNITLGSLTSTAAGGSLVVSAGGTLANSPVITTTTDKDATGIYGGRTVYFDGTANTGYDWATSWGAGPYMLAAYAGIPPCLLPAVRLPRITALRPASPSRGISRPIVLRSSAPAPLSRWAVIR